MSTPLLDVRELSAGADDLSAPAVFERLSFSVGRGERVAIIGPSGSGKTTLVRLILGLDRPVRRRSGTVSLAGVDIYGLSSFELRALRQRDLAFVPQNPASALDPLKTLQWQWDQNLSTIVDAGRRRDAHRFLTAFGIRERLSAYPCEWSRGMLQRLLIAMGLARGPRLLIMDEPTSALDPILAAEITKSVLNEIGTHGTALLLVTHHAGFAAALTERTIAIGPTSNSGADKSTAGARASGTRGGGSPDHAGLAAPAPIIEAKSLTVTLGRRAILTNISLRLCAGESLGIIGESGAGKTTLVRTLLGLLPPSRGAVLRQDGRLSLVSQDPLSALNPAMTIFNAIAEPLLARNVAKQAIATRVRDVSALVDLDSALLARTSHKLSVGQAQRVCIARALASAPSLIAFDEPLSALDARTAEEVVAAIERVRSASGAALLLVTHDLGFAQRVADRIMVLKDGHMIESGAASAFFKEPRSDYGRALIEAAGTIGDLARVA